MTDGISVKYVPFGHSTLAFTNVKVNEKYEGRMLSEVSQTEAGNLFGVLRKNGNLILAGAEEDCKLVATDTLIFVKAMN